MRIQRVYVDTSVLGGCFDPEFRSWSLGLLDDFRQGALRPVLSDVTAAEIRGAPEAIRAIHAELVAAGAELIPVSEDVLVLEAAYEHHGVLSPRFRNDMLHIALATVSEADVLVSWNFRHIVRLDKIRLFSAVNLELGYRTISIYSPREVTSHGRDD